MATVLLILQIFAALLFLILMAVQTDRAQQSGVMGLGGQGGRMGGEIDMPVGAERILKPLSKWTAVGFLFLSILAALNSEIAARTNDREHLPLWALPLAVVIYAAIMLYGDRVWAGVMKALGAGE